MTAEPMTPLDRVERAYNMTRFLVEIFGMCETEDRKVYHDRPIFLSEYGRSGLESVLRQINDDIYAGAIEGREL